MQLQGQWSRWNRGGCHDHKEAQMGSFHCRFRIYAPLHPFLRFHKHKKWKINPLSPHVKSTRLERQTGPASQQPLLGVSSGKVVGPDVANLDFGLVEHAFPMQSQRELVPEPPNREEASEEPKLSGSSRTCSLKSRSCGQQPYVLSVFLLAPSLPTSFLPHYRLSSGQ